MKVHNLTICEQVRQEVTGKFILLGVYSNGILVNNFPASFPLTVWCLLESERIGTSDFAFRLRMPAIDVTLIEMDGGMDAVDLKSWTPIAFGGQVQVPSEGEIIVESKDDSGEWAALRILHISKADLPLPPVGN